MIAARSSERVRADLIAQSERLWFSEFWKILKEILFG